MSKRDAYLLGTIPLDHIYQVFHTVAETLGDGIKRVPDGELGDRKMWVSSQYPVLGASSAIEVDHFPQGGVARSTSYEVPLRLKPDAKEISFGDLNFARWAITSYGVLRSMKEAGKAPKHWRLQVGLPAPQDVRGSRARRFLHHHRYRRVGLKRRDLLTDLRAFIAHPALFAIDALNKKFHYQIGRAHV